jgi:hypothetical protein
LTGLGTTNLASANGLTVGPDGTLYASALDQVYTVDRTSLQAQSIAHLPPGYFSSGDLVFVNGRLLVAARLGDAPLSDTLVEVSLTDGSTQTVGDFGYACVWGLATLGQELFGFTCGGEFISSDPSKGSSTTVTQFESIGFSGAASH